MSPTLESPHPVPGPPEAVRQRLDRRLLRIGSPWFPSLRDLREWDAADVPLYVRWTGPRAFEIGPRTESLWAACFCPVLRGHLQPAATGTAIVWTRTLPTFTRVVLGAWWVALAGWLVAIVVGERAGTDSWATLLWWSITAAGAAGGPWLGRHHGGRLLDEAAGWLRSALEP